MFNYLCRFFLSLRNRRDAVASSKQQTELALESIRECLSAPTPMLRQGDLERIDATHEELIQIVAETRETMGSVVANLTGELISKQTQINVIAKSLPDGFISLNYAGEILSCNPAGLELFGYSEKEIVGKPFYSLLSESHSAFINFNTLILEESNKFFAHLSKFFEADAEDQTKLSDIDPREAFHIYSDYARKGLNKTILNRYMEMRGVCADGSAIDVEVGFNILKPDSARMQDLIFIMLIRDVTDRNASMRKINEITQFNLSLIQSMPNPVFYKDRALNIAGCNNAFCTMLEIEPSLLIGRSSFDLYDHEWATIHTEEDAKLRDSNRHDPSVYYGKIVGAKSNKEYDVVIYKTAIFGANGEFNGIIGTIIDLTDMYRMKSFKDTLLAIIPNPVYWLDSNFKYAGCNAEYEKLVGRNIESIRGLSIREVRQDISIDNMIEYDADLRTTPTERQSYAIDYEDQSSVLKSLIVHRSALLDKEGDIEGVLGIITDISDIRREQRLQQSILESLPHPVFYLSADMKVISCNSNFESLVGLSKDQIIGHTRSEVFDKHATLLNEDGAVSSFAEMETKYRGFENILSSGAEERLSFEAFLPALDDSTGAYREVVCYWMAMFENSRFAGILGSVIDISEVKDTKSLHPSSLAENSPFPTFYRDEQHIYRDCNVAFCKLLGLAKSEVIGKHRDFVAERIKLSLREEGATIKELDVLMASGVENKQVFECAAFSVSSNSFRDLVLNRAALHGQEDGEFNGIISVMVDVTDIKRAKEAVNAKDAELSALMDATSDMVTIESVEGEVLRTNRAANDFQISYRPYIDGEYAKAMRELHTTAIQTRHTVLSQIQFEAHLGTHIIHDVVKVPLLTSSGCVKNVLTISKDVTNTLDEIGMSIALASVLEDLSDAVIILNRSFDIIYLNKQASLYAEESKDMLIGRNISSIANGKVVRALADSASSSVLELEFTLMDAELFSIPCSKLYIKPIKSVSQDEGGKFYTLRAQFQFSGSAIGSFARLSITGDSH